MKIQTLTLKNFRSQAETVLALDRLNFIRGPNCCGKSSVQMALEYLLTGRCQLTDGAGRGVEALIRTGEKELEVSATLENGDTICRRRSARSHVVEINGQRVPVDTAEATVEKRFGSADVLSAVLNADRFVEMSEAEQKKFLAHVVDAGRIEIPEQIHDALRTIGEGQPKLASIRDVEAAHKRFLGLYEDASRALQAMNQREQLEASERQTSSFTFQKLDADICRRNTQGPIQQVEAKIEEPLLELPSLWEEEELLEIDSWSNRAKELRRQLADLGAEQGAVEKSLTVMQGLKGKCPSCGQLVPEAAKAKEMEILRERLAELENLIQSTREELNCYRDPKEAPSPEDQATQKPGAAEVTGRVPICAERMLEGNLVEAKAQRPRVAEGPLAAYASDKSVFEKRLNVLKCLTDFFGPNGAVIHQASRRMQPFKETLNQQLAIFGYACNLTLEPFEIRVASSSWGGSGLLLK
jgi:DNA repair exonuclease SbcCD ATPase subunit